MKIKKVWITRPELDEILSGWSPSATIDIGDIGGLIPGSIPFADASGFLTEDNTAFFWDAASEILKITSATALLIDLYPGFTGSGHVIDITPSAPIGTVDALWEAVVIDGDALDPSAIGVELHGIHVDFSTVDLTNNPHIDGMHVIAPAMLSGVHAYHSDGEIHVDIDAAGGVAGETYTALNVIIATIGSTGGDLHALDVARSGNGSLSIAAIGTHEEIDVIHQDIGTFAAADKIWEYDNDGPGWTDVTAGVGSIWDDKDDLLYVGHASPFSEIKFMFTVVATKDMHFKFYFSEGGAVWTQFFPADDTEGATQNGSVKYTASALAAWAVETVNGTANKYWIQIERTRTSGTGPTASSMQQLAPTLYSWDKLGAITALSLSAGQITDTGVTATNVAAGTVGERPGGVVGDIRYNSTLGVFEIYTGAWKNIIATGDNVVFGTIGCGTITVANGSSINLQEDITFTGATAQNLIKFPDHLVTALSFREGANAYLTFKTTNGAEAVILGKNLIIPDAGYIGSVSDPDAIQIEADGDVVLTQDLDIAGSLTAGATSLITSTTDISLNFEIKNNKAAGQGDVFFNMQKAANGFSAYFYFSKAGGAGTTQWRFGTGVTAIDDVVKLINGDGTIIWQSRDTAPHTFDVFPGGVGTVAIGGTKVTLPNIPSTDAGDYDLRYDAADGIVYDTSDRRQKKNRVALEYGLAEILQLNPKSYLYHVGKINYEEDKKTHEYKVKNVEITDKTKESFGLIAQDVYDIIPEVVYKPKDESKAFWGLREKKLIPIMINAIKELNTKIKLLEAQLSN